MSARERRPQTGRSNRSDYSQSECKTVTTASTNVTVTSSMIAKWNDTLAVSRDFSPRDPHSKPVKLHPPIFPTSRFPTIPPYDEPPRRKRPLTCPESWIEEAQKPSAFDSSAMAAGLTQHEKEQHCREFIERNRTKLWQYNMDYKNRTPRELCKEITEDLNFLAIMTLHHRKEKVLALGSSNNIRDVFYEEENHHRSESRDPFSASMTTSRTARQRKLEGIIQPALYEDDGKNRRGYHHMPEYGNFSKFNSILKQNAGSVLKR
jgi:hypothetical protein